MVGVGRPVLRGTLFYLGARTLARQRHRLGAASANGVRGTDAVARTLLGKRLLADLFSDHLHVLTQRRCRGRGLVVGYAKPEEETA